MFMRYVEARYWEHQRDTAYRFYVTDGMYLHGKGQTFGSRFCDLIRPRITDTRSGDEIAADVIERLGLQIE